VTELRVDRVHAGYGKKEILCGVTLDVDKGDLLAVIGPNGAGKSTLLKVIAGFLKPTGGAVWLGDRNVTGLTPHERVRAGIGYFMQGGRVFTSLTVGENLALAAGGRPGHDLDEALQAFPNLVGIKDRRAGLLSGGERQSLALAMTLAKRPAALLLDEPSAGLSPRLVLEMLDKVREVAQNWGLTVIMVEQNVREALRIAHRACALVEGNVATQTDSPGEWASGKALETLFLGSRAGRAGSSSEFVANSLGEAK
jgi:branched-chain amino acid transport system ATP-binding protein